MSSGPPSAAPSPGAEGESAASLTRARGEVLLATASYAVATAVELGLDADACLVTREAARLHDVGKLYVRSGLLSRPEAELSGRARRELDAQSAAGHRVALGAGVPASACEAILRAGVRFDAGGEVPIASRIIAAACEYDTLLRHSASGDAARRRAFLALVEAAGGSLDPAVVDALGRVIERAAGTIAES